MASFGNVRLSYQAAAGLLLLLLLIIIGGSAEGWRSTVHHLTATEQLTNVCLAAILAYNSGRPFAWIRLVHPLNAYVISMPDGNARIVARFVVRAYFPPLYSGMLLPVTAVYTLLAAGLVNPVGYVDGKALDVKFDLEDVPNF
ncbi:hypothetical protein AXF42_Ash018914 [Apostasia shenzhenica]|uniref:Uncharacterized protein n=1 Tax=Apostasia shenzhenica TaxID=1088818 RepID=A0A2I0B557_9ASPA|nr:hypothetical protein AXF42_Ash018914 [Apostasia shenzhenica]